MSLSTSELRVRLARCETGLSPPVKVFGLSVPRQCFFCGSVLLVMFHVGVLQCRVCSL